MLIKVNKGICQNKPEEKQCKENNSNYFKWPFAFQICSITKSLKYMYSVYIYMSKIVSLSDEAYSKLNDLKQALNTSFSGSVIYLMAKTERKNKNFNDLAKWCDINAKKSAKSENISGKIDEIVYGAKK